MGSLTGYLQRAFVEHCPRGWVWRSEALVRDFTVQRPGFAPRPDVMLKQHSTSRRVWTKRIGA